MPCWLMRSQNLDGWRVACRPTKVLMYLNGNATRTLSIGLDGILEHFFTVNGITLESSTEEEGEEE